MANTMQGQIGTGGSMTLQDVNKFSANPGSVVAGAINGHP